MSNERDAAQMREELILLSETERSPRGEEDRCHVFRFNHPDTLHLAPARRDLIPVSE
jgi:hypothetical protein